MSKTKRFLIVLAAIAVAAWFLWPSIQWHLLTAPQDKANALSSRERIRDFSLEEAQRALVEIQTLAKASDTDKLDPKYDFMVEIAKRKYVERDLKQPAVWTADAIVYGYGVKDWSAEKAPNLLKKDIEEYHRDRVLEIKRLQNRAVKLGLDLSGGISIVLQANFDDYAKKLEETRQAAKAQETAPVEGPVVPAAPEVAGAAVSTLTDAEKANAMTNAIEVLTQRIDTFGLTEPVIRQMGADQIYIELPGAPDPERINAIIMESGNMSFNIVDDVATSNLASYLSNNPDGMSSDGTCADSSIIPAGYVARKVYEKDDYGIDKWTGEWKVVTAVSELDGSHVVDARSDQGDMGNFTTHFTFDMKGAEIFGRLTGENKDKFLAVIVNDRIKIYARIQSHITTGAVSLTGKFSADEAEYFAKMLRTSSLPMSLNVVNQSTIGASLGEDKIHEGQNAIIIGLLAVFVMMLCYYKGAGVNATLAQVLNLFFMFSILSVFGLTLTLPSIAGFVLTTGMAVDANVVIFERIKEELRLGKGRRASIDAGFHKAFWAVMDSNVTTIIAALFLAQLGSGAVRGFAVSLAIGNISSLFTALFVSRLIFDFQTDVLKSQKVSISWRVK